MNKDFKGFLSLANVCVEKNPIKNEEDLKSLVNVMDAEGRLKELKKRIEESKIRLGFSDQRQYQDACKVVKYLSACKKFIPLSSKVKIARFVVEGVSFGPECMSDFYEIPDSVYEWAMEGVWAKHREKYGAKAYEMDTKCLYFATFYRYKSKNKYEKTKWFCKIEEAKKIE